VLVLSQLKPFSGKGFQTRFLFQKESFENVLKLSKTSCFDIQRKFLFWLAASLLKNTNFQKDWEKKNQPHHPTPN